MDPAKEAGKDRRRVYLACHQCRSRKIKCDGAHPVCSTCIRRRSPKCDYDDEPRRRGPDRHPRVHTHPDLEPLSSIHPRRSQKRFSNDVGTSPATPSSTQSPPDTTPDVSAIISRTGLSKRPPTPPGGSLDSSRLYPSPSASGVFQQGSGNETLTHDLFGGSLSMRPSHSYLHHPETRLPRQMIPSYFLLFLTRAVHPGSFPALGLEPSPSTGSETRVEASHSYRTPQTNLIQISVVTAL
ncbi:hypothetical protein BS47DRAFT_1085144 [Hydnum rufescens UP504]|uniref:Zn(2)-C6 fungal-type domain-containing protein n=1 Tax=Hydnum rufescens UP504 TaxID=1448309 RepID=A0A9P6BA63_9AGAM|nr:hypothetical protein BS47DRAFT_1085144 [Hydnum rufescens UP504]